MGKSLLKSFYHLQHLPDIIFSQFVLISLLSLGLSVIELL